MSIEQPYQGSHDSTPYDTFVDDEGNVTVPRDLGAEITNEFMSDAEKARLDEWEAAAKDDVDTETLENGIEPEQELDAKTDIQIQLALIAIKQLDKLQDSVLDARLRGDTAGYLRELAKLEKHLERNPGLNNSLDQPTDSDR